MRTQPKPLYDATISYRTPAGRRVLFGSMIPCTDMLECRAELERRLDNEVRFGRRRLASVLDDFSARYITMQIGKPCQA
jgi:hypothetical protein